MSDLLIKVLALLILAAISAVFLGGYNTTAAMLTVLSATALIFTVLLKTVFPAVTALDSLFESAGNEKTYFTSALKALGIAYLSGFAADVCRDFGQNAIASKAEFAGRCAIFIISVPMMTGIVETALELSKL